MSEEKSWRLTWINEIHLLIKQARNNRTARLGALALAAGFCAVGSKAAPMEKINVPIAPGPCEPTWMSLGDHFRQPKWWRAAKIGMWLHWGPQSVGEDGDWYAKWIYMPHQCWGDYSRVYPGHLKRFGHPSEYGYKDILPLWKAENWDPDKLMALYRRAGARYVIGQGMHHDNFDLWNSKYQPWNAVKLGPHRDILGGWKQAADKQGIRFGIAFHGDYSLWWLERLKLLNSRILFRSLPTRNIQLSRRASTFLQILCNVFDFFPYVQVEG